MTLIKITLQQIMFVHFPFLPCKILLQNVYKVAWYHWSYEMFVHELYYCRSSTDLSLVFCSSFSFSIQAIFLLQIFPSFSFSVFLLLRKHMFPSPNIFLLFLLRFSSPLKKYFSFSNFFLLFLFRFFSPLQGNIFVSSKYLPLFPSLFFTYSAKKYFLSPNMFLRFFLLSSLRLKFWTTKSTNWFDMPIALVLV